MHENLKHTVINHLTKKKKKYSHFQTVTTNNSKHSFRFHIKQHWQSQGVTTNWYYTLFQSSYQIILTLSWSYYQTRFKHIFRVHIKHYWRFQTVTPKQYYILFQISNNIDLFRAHIKQHSHFHKVITKK